VSLVGVIGQRLRRCYDAPIGDVWDACTNPERIARWFMPVTGDFRPQGREMLDDISLYWFRTSFGSLVVLRCYTSGF